MLMTKSVPMQVINTLLHFLTVSAAITSGYGHDLFHSALGRWRPTTVLLRGRFFAYYSHPEGPPSGVVSLGLVRVHRTGSEESTEFALLGGSFSRRFIVSTPRECDHWVAALQRMSHPLLAYRFRSFAPVRHNVRCRAFVNGKEYFEEIYEACGKAKRRIMIASWYLSSGLLLKRDYPFDTKTRLDKVLLRAAKRGVVVYILIWNASKFVFQLDSTYNMHHFNSLHENIHIMEHPNIFGPLTWSHHQKCVVIDDAVAYIGGFGMNRLPCTWNKTLTCVRPLLWSLRHGRVPLGRRHGVRLPWTRLCEWQL